MSQIFCAIPECYVLTRSGERQRIQYYWMYILCVCVPNQLIRYQKILSMASLWILKLLCADVQTTYISSNRANLYLFKVNSMSNMTSVHWSVIPKAIKHLILDVAGCKPIKGNYLTLTLTLFWQYNGTYRLNLPFSVT